MHDNQTAEPRTLGDHTWHNQAACLPTAAHPVDPEIFFPEPDEMDRIRAAKALCAQCPVLQTCLDAALEAGDREGIRGGMTEEEREPLHRNLPRRLDYVRVNATLAGRDIHLTDAERRAVTRSAYQAGIPAARLARLLKVTEEHAEKRYRQARREIRNRAVDSNADQALGAARTSRDDLGTAA
ncbi:WhiB family transcriptional regulator [Streptomyces iranensis]|uniref:Transcriptional regulator WhiB n=1 Tax=Streptomyces iranensis TaxID=576784 RepID=A0A060ZVZ7_9ACTN|nr:WhiB family transcriptional regulator [Streptomyces iranensis]MBP2059593.1 WhiB family redox-sensing transcriptional regulator [Streptomyces iranensis]CDR10479.1 transcription factor WhiB [Streptomyces iranensis]